MAPIEVKSEYNVVHHYNNINPKESAMKQLKIAQEVMQTHFHGILGESWHFAKSVCFYKLNLENEYLCEECKPWVLTKDTDLEEWWNTLEQLFPIKKEKE